MPALHVGFPTRRIGRSEVPLATHRALVLSAMLGGVVVLPILDILPRKLVFLALPLLLGDRMHGHLHVAVVVVGRNDDNNVLGDNHAHNRIIVAQHCILYLP